MHTRQPRSARRPFAADPPSLRSPSLAAISSVGAADVSVTEQAAANMKAELEAGVSQTGCMLTGAGRKERMKKLRASAFPRAPLPGQPAP